MPIYLIILIVFLIILLIIVGIYFYCKNDCKINIKNTVPEFETQIPNDQNGILVDSDIIKLRGYYKLHPASYGYYFESGIKLDKMSGYIKTLDHFFECKTYGNNIYINSLGKKIPPEKEIYLECFLNKIDILQNKVYQEQKIPSLYLEGNKT